MEIRPATPADLDSLVEIDGTIESARYLYLERAGERLAMSWRLEERPLASKLIESNPLNDEQRFALKQILTGADEGSVLMAEHEGAPVGLAVAQPRGQSGTMHLLDLRVDYDFRRQGIGTVLVYQIIQQARENEMRAVSAETRTNNLPANQLLQKLSFEIAGLDTHRHSNHDLVKESATLLWYAALD